MKKITFYISVLFSTALLAITGLSSCKSTKQSVEDSLDVQSSESSDNYENFLNSSNLEDQNLTLSKKEEKKLEKEQKKAEKEEAKKLKKEKKSETKENLEEDKKVEGKNEVTSENSKEDVAVFPKEFVKDVGIVRLRYKRALGTFGVSVLNAENQAFPVFSTANEFTKTAFFLKVGSRQYKLISSKLITPDVSNSSNGMTIIYSISDVADVTVCFEVFSPKETIDADILKITANVKNKSTRNETFALKAILDTILGESAKAHFYDVNNLPVKSELLLRDTNANPMFTSKNNSVSMQVILNGADISPLDLVALANYSTLDKATWEPEMLSYRSFDTLMSYNNSAIGLIWPEVKLSPERDASFTFYLSFATDDGSPSGYAFINGLEVEKEEKSEIPNSKDKDSLKEDVNKNSENEINGENSKGESSSSDLSLEKKIEDDEKQKNKEEEILPLINNVPPKNVNESEKEIAQYSKPNVKFDINNLSKEQLTPEYIQNLIDRINALEENSDSVNRNELLQLNAELDAILQTLRQ